MNAIVIGQRGVLRDGLIALLDTQPEIKVVSSTEHRASVTEMIRANSASFVLLQVDAAGQGWRDWIRSLKARWPETKLLALVQEPGLQPRYLDAGADLVLMQDGNTARLREAISTLVRSS